MSDDKPKRRRQHKTFKWLQDSRRPPSEYEEVTALYCTWGIPFMPDQKLPGVGNTAQPFLMNPEVRPIHGYMTPRTEWRSEFWEGYRDPAKRYYKVYNQQQWESEQSVDAVFGTAKALRTFETMNADYRRDLLGNWAPLRYVEWAIVKAFQDVAHVTPSSPICQCATFQLFDGLRHVQRNIALTLALTDGEAAYEPKTDWLKDERWQGLRRFSEELMAASGRDWGETVIAANLALRPVLSTALYQPLMARAGAAGDIGTAHLCNELHHDHDLHTQWTEALVEYLHGDEQFGDHNAELTQRWLDHWGPRAADAVRQAAEAIETAVPA